MANGKNGASNYVEVLRVCRIGFEILVGAIAAVEHVGETEIRGGRTVT